MKILDTKYDDGTDVIKKLNWVKACAECKKRGVPEKCRHVNQAPQHFQSYASQARLRALLSQDQGAYDREMLYVLSAARAHPPLTRAGT